ncbi:hypothetical protein ERJ75_001327600 [Trypanosoma vivax]|nr:hypothetical protein ERJ75_001327600 [Trypanosoma vivax]
MSGVLLQLCNPFAAQTETESNVKGDKALAVNGGWDVRVQRQYCDSEDGAPHSGFVEWNNDEDDSASDDCPTPPYVPCRFRFGLSAPAFEFEMN